MTMQPTTAHAAHLTARRAVAHLTAQLSASVLAATAIGLASALLVPAHANNAAVNNAAVKMAANTGLRAHVHTHGQGHDGGYWPSAQAHSNPAPATQGSAQLSCLTPGAAAAGITLKTALPASQAGAKTDEAVNRLRVGTLVQFDARVRTVGDAMVSLLAPARYRITNRTVDPAASAALMRRPLPVAARDAGLMSIEKGLLLLIGEDHRLVVDHRNRHVAVERLPAGESAAAMRLTSARP
jgi:hypothetical protein